MSQEERYGTRDQTYSVWHRRMSTRRYVGIERAQHLAMIDVDASVYIEYDDETKEPLAVIETAEDVGQSNKVATVTKNLAKKANIAGIVLLYKKDPNNKNPANEQFQDICMFRYRRLWPEPESVWVELTPGAWCDVLLKLRGWMCRKLDKQYMEDAG